MKKKHLLYILLAIISIIAIGCQKEEITEIEPKNFKFYYPDGTPALTVAKLAKEKPEIYENIRIDYELQKSPDLLVSKILKEEADIAIVPSNLAAQAFNKELSYKILGTPTWGAMYLTSTRDIDSFEELKGEEIYAFGKGLTPDLVLRYVLANNGIDPDSDVNISYLNSAQEMGPAFLSGKTDLALLPEPLLSVITMKKEDAKVVLDLNSEWGTVAGVEKGFPQSSLIIKEELIEENGEFVENFIKEYEASRKWAIENMDKLSEYAEELDIGVAKDIIEKGIIWTNPQDFHIEDSIGEYEAYYRAILDFAPDFIGGKVPGEEIYFER